MGDTAANRATIANLIMRNVLDCSHQQRVCAAQSRVVEDVAPARHCAKPDAVIGDLDLPQFGEPA